MYESPIDIIFSEMETQIENDAMKAVQSLRVNVNKEELLKALQYDRGQYLKGYKDGLYAWLNAGGWIPCSERLPEESLNSVIGWDEYRNRCVFVQYYCGRWILGNDEGVKIIAWMPLPEPYKGE